MDNNTALVQVIKCWNYKDGGYGQKDYWINPVEIAGLEPCKIKEGSREVECTKIFYNSKSKCEIQFLIIKGSPKEFFDKCKEANTAIFVLSQLNEFGISIKTFLKQLEGLNINQ